MEVTELKPDLKNVNLNYIEQGIKKYIKDNNYPKKLVLTNINNEIAKRKDLIQKIDDKNLLLENEIVKYTNMIEELKITNSKKIHTLMSAFGSSIF